MALRILHLMSVGTVAALMTASSHATLYLSTAAWEAAVGGPIEEIGFHEPGVAMRIEEYYADRGVHFLAGGQVPSGSVPVRTYFQASTSEWYLLASSGYNMGFTITFDEPILAISMPYCVSIAIFAYSGPYIDDNTGFVEAAYNLGGPLTNPAADWGVVFSQPVRTIYTDRNPVGINTLRWSTVPAPSAAALLLLAGTARRRRR